MAKIKKFKTEGKKMKQFTALPAGTYLCEMKESEWKDTENGEMLACTFEVIKGEFKGRKIFENLNLVHSNPTVVDIAEGELADINRACGNGEKLVADSEKLHNIPIDITVKVTQSQKYGEGNAITAVAPKGKGSSKDEDKGGKKKKGKGEEPPWSGEEEGGKKDKKEKKKDKKGGKKKK